MALPSRHDTDNAPEIRTAFEEGVKWADSNRISHKRDATHYADQYLRSVKQGEPIIPKFMRLYCAWLNGTRLAGDESIKTIFPFLATPCRPKFAATRPGPRLPVLRQPAFMWA